MAPFDLKRLLFTMNHTKKWWVPLVLLVIVAGNLAGLTLPKKYKSTASILINRPPVEIQQADAMHLKMQETLDTLYQRITAFSFMADVADSLNMDAGMDPKSPQYTGLIERMRDSIELRVTNNKYILISYIGFTPQEARDVTEAIIEKVIIDTSEGFLGRVRESEKFIAQELDNAKKRRDEAQRALVNFKRLHNNEILDALAEHQKRLARLRDERQTTQQKIESTKEALALARQQLDEIDPQRIGEKTVQGSQEVQRLKSQRRGLEMQLELMLQDFTEEHWQVQELQKQLELIDKQIDLEEQNQIETVTTEPNPEHSNLKETIQNYQLQLAQLTRDLLEIEKDVDQLNAYMEEIPTRQAEFENLQRNYAEAASQAEFFQRKLIETRMTIESDMKGMGPSFVIYDPPRLPTDPASPNRKKIFLASVAMGFGAGGALIYLLMLLDSAVRTVDEARKLLQMPVLGVVQRIVSPAELARQRRRRLLQTATVSAGTLLLVLVFTYVYFNHGSELASGVNQLRSLIGQ